MKASKVSNQTSVLLIFLLITMARSSSFRVFARIQQSQLTFSDRNVKSLGINLPQDQIEFVFNFFNSQFADQYSSTAGKTLIDSSQFGS